MRSEGPEDERQARKAGRGSQGALTLPSADDVVLLQVIRDYPAVTLLMCTTPATVMTRDDATALRGMARRAAERLRREDLGAVEGAVIAAMERLTAQAATGPTSTAIAVYASRATAEIHRLPVSVRDRVVIDPTFATRDLIRALHRTPRHVVLVLTSREARLLELLDRRTSARRVASGMPAVWLAARRERPEMLAVEEGLFYPARDSPDGDVLTPAGDVEHPDVVDDAVDELIELVLVRGGWVALVADRALAAHERVALTLLPGDGR